MSGSKKILESDDRLDRLGRAIVRASASGGDAVAEAVASSPFLSTRLRARIAAERERREAGDGWLALLGVVWRSAPAMALAAVFAFALFWYAGPASQSPGVLSDEALLGARDAGIEQVVFADSSPLSRDDVLTTILSDDEREAQR